MNAVTLSEKSIGHISPMIRQCYFNFLIYTASSLEFWWFLLPYGRLQKRLSFVSNGHNINELLVKLYYYIISQWRRMKRSFLWCIQTRKGKWKICGVQKVLAIQRESSNSTYTCVDYRFLISTYVFKYSACKKIICLKNFAQRNKQLSHFYKTSLITLELLFLKSRVS